MSDRLPIHSQNTIVVRFRLVAVFQRNIFLVRKDLDLAFRATSSLDRSLRQHELPKATADRVDGKVR